MHKRKMKSALKKNEQRSNANPQCTFQPFWFTQTSVIYRKQVYHGARGRYHYFLCQQHLLRMQVEAITKLWNLPPEFEVQNSTYHHTPFSLMEKADRLPWHLELTPFFNEGHPPSRTLVASARTGEPWSKSISRQSDAPGGQRQHSR